jgi:hypothetical protein
MTFRMRPASKTCRRPATAAACGLKNFQRACLPLMFPPTSLARACPSLIVRRSSSARKTQRIEAQVKRCGDEDRHLRSLSLRLRPIWIFDRLKKERFMCSSGVSATLTRSQSSASTIRFCSFDLTSN